MNPRFQGYGKLIILVPVLSYIPLRLFFDAWEDSHRSVVLSVIFLVSGLITLLIAAVQDKKAGIELLSRRAWTSDLMESQHIFYHLPIRVVGVLSLAASVITLFVKL